MNQSLVLSILSDDKPGVVETLAKTINDHQGNWLESRLSQLAGKFAGILHISVPEEQLEALQTALRNLQSSRGIQVATAAAGGAETGPGTIVMQFSLMGNDRAGIIREISQAFVSHGINLEELDTSCSSMPWSGTPMFTANGLLRVPDSVDIELLADQLEAIADELGVDFELRETESPVAD